MTADIGTLARIAYEAGIAPLDYAEDQIVLHIAASDALAAARVTDPERFAGYPAPRRDVLARRILAALLDAGWGMPVWPIPEPHQEPS